MSKETVNETTYDFRDPMTDSTIGWRTVATHGQPTEDDLPVLIDDGCSLFWRAFNLTLTMHTRWIPLAAINALPDAPPPARTVTITVTGGTRVSRVMAAIAAALKTP